MMGEDNKWDEQKKTKKVHIITETHRTSKTEKIESFLEFQPGTRGPHTLWLGRFGWG